MKINNRAEGHTLIIVMIFLMLSSLLLFSALETLKQDSLSLQAFEGNCKT